MIAVILTCHNRKDKTLSCLRSLNNVSYPFDIYLTDDGCTDGTSEAIKREFPKVNIIKGNGNLFWSRGMYTAWEEAIKYDYDYYLWLNDDIELLPDFMEELFYCQSLYNNQCIISGLIADKFTKKIIYGGTDSQKVLNEESTKPKEISFMNGNVVLIPRYVVNKIGILDPVFHHDLGDVDYGLTAIENNIKIYTTRKITALGYENNYCRVRKWNGNIFTRFKKLYSPLGSNPKINFYFRKKHFGVINALEYWLYIHIINILPDNIIKLFFGKKYIDN